MGDRIASGLAGGALKGTLAVSDGQGWQLLSPPGTASLILSTDPTTTLGIKWTAAGAGSGSVTSVDMTVPSWLAVTGNPITTSGTLTVAAAAGQTANRVLATPDGSTGAVDLRALTANDIPALAASKITSGQIGIANGGTGQATAAAAYAALSPLTTKGDLVSYGSSPGRLAVGADGQVLTADSTQPLGVKWAAVAGGGGGTVTSVGLSLPAEFTVTGSPVTTSGTISVTRANQTANTVMAGPTSGPGAAPSFRALVAADLPTTGLNIASHYGAITADSDGATITFDLGASDKHAVTLGGNRTLALSNPTTGQVFTVILTQDATGSRTVTWWSGIKWAGGSPPTLTTTASKADIFTFICYGANTYYGMVAGQNL